MEVVVAVAVCILVFTVLWKILRNDNRPPGPWGLPILGYIPFLSKKPYLDLQRLAGKYGKIFSIRMGSHYMIVLNDFQSCKEAFAQDAYIGRPPDFSFEVNEKNKETEAFSGLPWKEQRRVSLHMLRDLGFGKSKLEGQLQEEIHDLLEHFKRHAGKPFNVKPLLSPSMSNNIGALMFGRRFKLDDPVREFLTNSVGEIARAGGQVSWQLFFPWVKNICKVLGIGEADKLNRAQKEFREFANKEIEEHERTLDPENVRDFIDGYLLEIRKRKGEPAFCSSETVQLSVEWLLLAAANDQAAQSRIHTEIDEVIGRERLAIWEDHKLMPYSNAFMMEMQRWRTLIPLNLVRYSLIDTELNGYYIPKHTQILANLWAVHHDPEIIYELLKDNRTLVDTELNGYSIPKHTQILANLWAVHHDPEYWGPDADEFRPERFLEEDGKTVKKWERYIPFSTGKRACPGEPLAKVEIFLYFIAIMQKFDIRFPDGKVGNFDSDLGIGLTAKIQEIIVTPRS